MAKRKESVDFYEPGRLLLSSKCASWFYSMRPVPYRVQRIFRALFTAKWSIRVIILENHRAVCSLGQGEVSFASLGSNGLRTLPGLSDESCTSAKVVTGLLHNSRIVFHFDIC